MTTLKLTGYTLYRFFSDARRVFAVVLLLFLNFAAFRAFDGTQPASDSGEILGENAVQTSTPLSDTVKSADEYRLLLSGTLAKAEDALEGVPEDSVLAVYQRDVIEVYVPLADEIGGKLEDAAFSDSRIFAYRVDLLFLAALVFLIVKTACCDDTALDLTPILRTTRNGRFSLGMAKLFSACIVILGGILLTTGAEVLFSVERIGWTDPVQAVGGLALCPHRLTALGVLLLSCLFRFLILTLFAGLLMTAEAVLRDFWGTLISAAALAGIDAALSLRSVPSVFSIGAHLGCLRLADGTSWLARLGRSSLAGRLFPALLIPGLLLPAVLGLVIASYLVLSVHPIRISKQRRKPKERKILPASEKQDAKPLSVPHRMSLLRGEARKVLFSGRVPLIVWIALLLAADVVFCVAARPSPAFDDRIYAKLMAPYTGGEWDNAKSLKVSAQASRLDEQLALFRGADAALAAGRITEEEYREIWDTLSGIEITRNVFRRIERIAAHLDAESLRGEENLAMVYDSGWEQFFSRRPDVLLAAAAALIGISAFSVEYGTSTSSGSMAAVIRATKKGRRPTLGAKALLLLTAVFLCFLITEGASVLTLRSTFAFPGADRSLCSLVSAGSAGHGLTVSGSTLTVGGEAVISEGLRFGWALGIAFVSAALTVLTRSTLPALFVLLATAGLPAVLSLPEKIDLTLVSSGGMEAVTGGMLPASVYCVFVLILCVIFADRRWRVT
jgi:hypothetical protein